MSILTLTVLILNKLKSKDKLKGLLSHSILKAENILRIEKKTKQTRKEMTQ